MANLTIREKIKLERFFEMEAGYVADFQYTTYRNFFIETVNVDIFEEKYGENNSGSKANRMRAFWTLESNYIVSKLLNEMLAYWKDQLLVESFLKNKPFDQNLYDECKKIVERIAHETSVVEADALTPNSPDKDFKLLAELIKRSINEDKLEQALDRLHTFVKKYLRVLCQKHEIIYDRETPLNILVGGYIKYLRDNSLVDSKMSLEILKSSIKVLESFDNVRNTQTLAHDNPLLNKKECTLIFNYIAASIRFINLLENEFDATNPELGDSSDEFYMEEVDVAIDLWIDLKNDIKKGK